MVAAPLRRRQGVHPCLPPLSLRPIPAKTLDADTLERLPLLHSVRLFVLSANGLKGEGQSAVRPVSGLEGCGVGRAELPVFHDLFANCSEGGEP
jgi:hypothetical protein